MPRECDAQRGVEIFKTHGPWQPAVEWPCLSEQWHCTKWLSGMTSCPHLPKGLWSFTEKECRKCQSKEELKIEGGRVRKPDEKDVETIYLSFKARSVNSDLFKS